MSKLPTEAFLQASFDNIAGVLLFHTFRLQSLYIRQQILKAGFGVSVTCLLIPRHLQRHQLKLSGAVPSSHLIDPLRANFVFDGKDMLGDVLRPIPSTLLIKQAHHHGDYLSLDNIICYQPTRLLSAYPLAVLLKRKSNSLHQRPF